MRAAGIGRIYFWDGGSLLIGRGAGETNVHAHHALQITLTPEGGVRFRSAETPWMPYRAAIVAPNHPHAFDGFGRVVAHMFIEPESREGRAIAERWGGGGIAELPDEPRTAITPVVFDRWASTRDPAAMTDAARTVVRHLAGGTEPEAPVDERVARAVAFMKANVHRPLTLRAVAGAVHLSPSRFRHLFVEETGTTLRAYILWLRFQRAWERVSAGSTLSAAAHAAGFADSSHLTRTSQRMFGIAPAALQMELRG